MITGCFEALRIHVQRFYRRARGSDAPEVEDYLPAILSPAAAFVFPQYPKLCFEPKLAGTLAQIEIRVPVIRWIDVEVAAGWMFAIRPDVRTGAADDGGFVAGGGVISAGVAGKVPW